MLLGNRHIGRFRLGLDMFEKETDLGMARKILADVVVVKADVSLSADAIDYMGISDKYFGVVEPGQEAPVYTFSYDVNGNIECSL